MAGRNWFVQRNQGRFSSSRVSQLSLALLCPVYPGFTLNVFFAYFYLIELSYISTGTVTTFATSSSAV